MASLSALGTLEKGCYPTAVASEAGGVGTRGMGKRGRAEDKGKQGDDLIGI